MKTTVDLPSELVREIKLRAVNEGRKLKEVVSDLLRFGLAKGNALANAPLPLKGKVALPLFSSSPKAPASEMSLEVLISLEQAAQLEEDHARRG